MSKLSFVYFDVGGVAIQDYSDSNKWDVMMHDMGLDKFDREQVDLIYDSHDDEICLGKMHVDALIPFYVAQFGINLPPNFSMQEYFIDHFNRNKGLWPIINTLKHTCQVGLLTDIYPGMLDGIMTKQLLPPAQWDVIVDSSVESVRKPMPEIYDLAQSRTGVPAEEILFIDNREKNLVIPRKLGWQTFLYDSSNYDQANKDLATFLQL